jgi:hypothetical protein
MEIVFVFVDIAFPFLNGGIDGKSSYPGRFILGKGGSNDIAIKHRRTISRPGSVFMLAYLLFNLTFGTAGDLAFFFNHVLSSSLLQ